MGVNDKPDAICADAGSGDIGPFYLGSDAPYNPREWEKHDLRLMLLGARKWGVPMVVGSCGGAGTNRAVDLYVELIREIAAEENLEPFKLARIYSEVDREYLARRAATERIEGLGAPEPLSADDVRGSSRVVAMMGVEPIIEALNQGADVVLAGRSCDDAVFAAPAIARGFDKGLSLHMGKSIECGPLVATPVLQREAVRATVRENDFLVEPLHPGQRCTPASVAGHALYERTDPRELAVPGGLTRLGAARFEAFTDRICRVSGAEWVPDPIYRVKLEGSAFVGRRALLMFGLRDRLSIQNLDNILQCIRDEVRNVYPKEQSGKDYHITFHVYGRNAVMKDLEPVKEPKAHEIAVVIEAIGRTQQLATGIAKIAKYTAFRANYPGKLGIAGGAALIADEVLEPKLEAYRWTIDHLLPVADPCGLFPMTLDSVEPTTKDRAREASRAG
jgi:hypothetical protein